VLILDGKAVAAKARAEVNASFQDFSRC
jgi:hypothetical protein